MNIFLSMPLHGKSDDEIKDIANRMTNSIFDWLERRDYHDNHVHFATDHNIFSLPGAKRYRESILTSNDLDNAYDRSDRIGYLGYSIAIMSCCDLVVFHPMWSRAPGCRVEMQTCISYDIPYVILDNNYSVPVEFKIGPMENFYGPAAIVEDMLIIFRSLCEAKGMDFTDPAIAKPWKEMLDKVKNKEEE